MPSDDSKREKLRKRRNLGAGSQNGIMSGYIEDISRKMKGI